MRRPRNSVPSLAVLVALTVLVAGAGPVQHPATPSIPRFELKWGQEGTGDGEFFGPFDVLVTPSNTILVTDDLNGRVQEFDSLGHFLGKFGSWGQADGQMRNPRGIAMDPEGNIYIADTSNDRIQKFDRHGGFILKWG